MVTDTFKAASKKYLIPALVLLSAWVYAAFYFDYLQTPSADYIGNFRPVILQLQEQGLSFSRYKVLPAYPVAVWLAGKVLPDFGHDPIYYHAMILNYILFFFYSIIVYRLYRIFFDERNSMGAAILLFANIYTIYTALNAELEMFMTTAIVAALFFSLSGKKYLPYLFAFFGASSKWDSVFLVPAVMFRDVFREKKILRALLLGGLASTVVLLWIYFNMTKGSVYVGEIEERGPNIYRYFIDLVHVTSGTTIWTALQGYYEYTGLLRYILYGATGVLFLLTSVGIIAGARWFWREHREKAAPVLIFLSGFLLVHLVYQNSKARYVLPILWFTSMLLYAGIVKVLAPAIIRRYEEATWARPVKVVAGTVAIFISSLLLTLLIRGSHPWFVMVPFLFAIPAWLILLNNERKLRGIFSFTLVMLLFSGFTYYGQHAMDHYSTRRVEFRKAGEWFREHYRKGDRILVTSISVPRYYSGLEGVWMQTPSLKSKNYDELIQELKREKITHVFVDDFYIRRLQRNDDNATMRKASLMQEIRQQGVLRGDFVLVQEIYAPKDITGYIYRVRREE